jgi:hypothetical protein
MHKLITTLFIFTNLVTAVDFGQWFNPNNNNMPNFSKEGIASSLALTHSTLSASLFKHYF